MRDASFVFLVSDPQKILAGLKVLEASLHGLLPCKRDKGNNWSLHFLYVTFDKLVDLLLPLFYRCLVIVLDSLSSEHEKFQKLAVSIA